MTGRTGLPRRPLAVLVGAVGGTAALATVVGLALAGGAAAPVLGDPGAVVRWGLPLAELCARLSALLTIGALALAATVLPPGSTASAGRLAAPAAWAWATSQTAVVVLSAVNVAGGGTGIAASLGALLASPFGRSLAWAALLAGAVVVVLATLRGPARPFLALVVALLALVPVAAAGHGGATGTGHATASALWLHVGGTSVWVGGLLVLVAVLPRAVPDPARQAAVVGRFSCVAGWAFAVVAASGLLAATASLASPADAWSTAWGRVVLAKGALLVVLGVAGWAHRRRLVAGWPTGTPVPFLRLATGEVVVMAATVGLGVALSASPPPAVAGTAATLPPLGVATVLTRWSVEPVTATAAAAALVVYLSWVVRLHRRGDRWPVGRTSAGVAGVLLVVWVTSGGPAVYGHVLLSVHMVTHMALVTLVPVLAVVAAPVTLALRALGRRDDGSRGPREWLLALLSSRFARVLLHPVVATANVVVTMAVFYATPLFELSLTHGVVHLAAVLHFVLAGYAFTTILIGVDPVPHRPPYPLRLLMLAPAMVLHTVLGLTLVTSDRVLLAASTLAEARPWWVVDPVADQQAGGAVMWALGEVPALALAFVVAARWAASDARVERRVQRRSTEPAGVSR